MGFRDKGKNDSGKILDVDASMSGTLLFKDPVNLRINGKFDGVLETRGSLIIGPTAVVKANVTGDLVIVAGKFKGEILARQKLTLLPTAVVEGKMDSARLIVEEGAVLEAICHNLGDILNVDELAKYLELDVTSVMEWANTGKIPGIKEANSWKFERKTIDEWVAAGKVE